MAKKKFEMLIGGTAKDMYFAAEDVVTPVITVSATGDVSQALVAGKFYKFGSVDSLSLTLTAPESCADGTVALAEYGGKFTASADWGGVKLAIPSTVTEMVVNDEVEAGKTYEFSISDNVIVVKDVTPAS